MLNEPKITIVTVVYNGEKVLEPTILSVINQDFNNREYVIIDGNSSDKTYAIIEKYKNHFSTIISEPDLGVYDAMNKGLRSATGEYILFLNAGDELAAPNTLSQIFEHCDHVDLIYGETLIMNPNKEVIGTRTELTSRKLPKNLKKQDFLNGQVVSHQSFIPKRALAQPYDLRYECSSDINWMLEIMNKSKTVHNLNAPISKYLQGGISDRQLSKCWKERFHILVRYFGWPIVIWQHFKFALRFIKMGAYSK